MSITQTPAGNWEVRFHTRNPNNPAKLKLNQKTFTKYRAAVEFENKVKVQVREGDYQTPLDLTVTQIAEKFLEARKPTWKPQTYIGHKTHVRKYISPQLGTVKATKLQSINIEAAGADWGKLVDHKTVNKVFGTLNAIYKFAKKLGVKNNPMMDVERLRNKTTPEEYEALALGAIADHGTDIPEQKTGTLRPIRPDEVYSAVELRKILEAAKPGLEKAVLMTAMLTGLRHGELSALRWSIVDWKKAFIFVNRSLTWLKGGPILERPKTKNAYRRLKLAPELLSELRHWKLMCPPNPNHLIFVNERGRPTDRKQKNRRLSQCATRAGVRALSMNNLRHSFASQNLIAGVPPLKVSKLMGHSDPAVTLKVYSHWAEGEESNAEVLLADRIFAADDPSAQKGTAKE